MTTEKAAEKKLPGWKRWYRWWAILPSAIINCLGGYGMFYVSSGPFIVPWTKAFGWSRATATGAYSTGNLFQVIGPFLGAFMDRVGYRKAVLYTTPIMMIGALFLVFVVKDAPWMVYVGYILLCSIGLSIPTYGGATKTVNFWFLKRRNLAVGIVTAFTGLGYFFPALQGWIIEQRGVSAGGWYVFAWGFPILLLTFFLIRDKASDMGVGMDGTPLPAKTPATDGGKKEASPAKRAAKKEEKFVAEFSVWQAMRTRAFWLVIIAYCFLSTISNTFIVGNYVAFLQGLGMSGAAAGAMWGMNSFFGWPARFLFGPIGDWWGRGSERWLFAIGTAMMAIGVVGLLQVKSGADFFWVWWWTAWWGFGWGGNMTAMTTLFATYFGPKAYGAIYGTRAVFMGIAGFIGPVMGGLIYDITGNYALAFMIVITMLVIAVIMLVFASPPKVKAGVTAAAKA